MHPHFDFGSAARVANRVVIGSQYVVDFIVQAICVLYGALQDPVCGKGDNSSPSLVVSI